MSKIIPGVSPSMMCADALNLGADAVALEKAGVQYFHYDVMDGDFVPNFMLGPDVIKAVRKAALTFPITKAEAIRRATRA